MKHYGYVDKAKIELDFQLIIGINNPRQYNERPSVRVTAGQTALGKTERAINLKMSLPLALFEAPTISARIAIDDPVNPVHIDATAIGEAIRGIIGADVHIEITTPSEESN